MATSLFSGIGAEFLPKRKDMWSIVFPPEMGISERFEVSAARPRVTNNLIETKYKNSFTKWKGASKFENITIEFRDVIGPSVMQKLWGWQTEHYDPKTGCAGLPSIYKKNLILYLEDDCGNPVEKWNIYGAFIISLDGGELNMESDGEIATVSLEIAYDRAEMEY